MQIEDLHHATEHERRKALEDHALYEYETAIAEDETTMAEHLDTSSND